MLRSYMRYWPAVGGVIFAAVAILVGTFGDLLAPTQRLMSVFFMRQRHFLLKTALPDSVDKNINN